MTRLIGVFLVLLAAIVAPSCTAVGPSVVGSGRVVTEQREAGSFTKIRVGTAINATVIVGPDASVAVTADDNILPSISTNVTLGTLDVTLQGSSRPSTPIKVAITVPNLESLVATTAANVVATGVNNSTFEASADSAASLTARGNADSVNASASSAASVDIGGIPARTATVRVGSAGRATVNAQVSVTGSVDTGGAVHVEGNPATVNVTSDSGGAVVRD